MDKINKLVVPRGIRYISDWKEYSLENFQFPHILDKQIPGCGYTEYCITSKLPTILCSPRKILLENKQMQHPEDIFYFKNELDKDLGMDKDVTKVKIPKGKIIAKNEEIVDVNELLANLFNNLANYLSYCNFNNKIPKILVTYDSFRLVKEYLREHNLLQYFYIVIDEFQSVLTDSRFKSSTELEFMYQLQDLQKVCFVSATPMIDKYLERIDEFKNLPYFEIDWDTAEPGRVVVPDLKVRVCGSVNSAAKTIIDSYKAGDFESAYSLDSSGKPIEIKSTEAVLYVNSVTNIIGIIKSCDLMPEECNILCARTPDNLLRIKNRLGKKFNIGSVPLRGESHKMFTFCTRTVYLGADFYSDVARSFILSDANIESLAVDITLDLPQILGRQRLTSNPWKNRAELYYKTLRSSGKITKEEFDEIIQRKLNKTKNLLDSFSDTREAARQDVAAEYQKLAKDYNYRDHYVAVNKHAGANLIPCLNNLVLVAEQRAYDIQQKDYKDRFTVFNTIVENGLVNMDVTNNINLFLETFNSFNTFFEKMRYLCECNLNENEKIVILDQIPLTYKNYYIVIGPDRCKALSYNQTFISRELSDRKFDKANLENEIYNIFQVGFRYTKSHIKETLTNLYNNLGYNKTAKANDLEEFFVIKHCNVYNQASGKYDHGFEIISKKKRRIDYDILATRLF